MWVVTGLHLGWDCVVAVFPDTISLEKLQKGFPEGEYVITEQGLATEQDLDDLISSKD